jgi:hypothetical protein
MILSEYFNWEAAHLMLQILPQRREDLMMCCAASHATLVQVHLMEDWQVDMLSLARSKGEAIGKLGAWGVSNVVKSAATQHRELVEKLRGVESNLESLPRYLAVATRVTGFLAKVGVRYDRKPLPGTQGVRVGRAYPSVIDPTTGGKAQGVLALTAMPRQVRNAIICHPVPTLVDLDLVKCYPSILLALAIMWEIDPQQRKLLGEFVVRPKEHCERVAQDIGVDTSGAKDAINRIISDPERRHPPRHGWVSAFETEVHRLRESVVSLHPLKDQFWVMPRTNGGSPNVGTVVHRVITDYEVRVIAVAMQVFSRKGIRVCTYEYDGVKVLHEHWHAHDEAGRREILREVTEAVNQEVFCGRAKGIVRLVEKVMEYELYESDMQDLSVPMLGEGGDVARCTNPLFVPSIGGAECDTGDGVHESTRADCMAAVTPQVQADEGRDGPQSGDVGIGSDPPPQHEVADTRPRLRPRDGEGRVKPVVKGGEAWVCIEPLSHTMSAHTRGVKRKGKPPHSSKGEAPGPDPGPDLGPDLCGEARGVSPHPMGAIWTEPGWVSRRVGELSRTMRARLMARGTMEERVLESGVWQLDLQAPRIPATKRAGFASTEAYLRGFEGKGIWGLSGLEVAFRIQGRVPTLAPAGTVPSGESDGFWAQLECAQTSLRSRIFETDVDKVFEHLQEAREFKGRCGIVTEENRVFDPGVT